MVILMPGQGRPPCEGLLAVCIGALVRPLAGVDSAVPRKGAGVGEWLQGDGD